MAIDTVEMNSLLSLLGKGGTDAGILREVLCQQGDERHQKRHHEERQTGNPGRVPCVQNQNVQNWQELGLHLHSLTELRRAGFSRCGASSPFVLRITLNKLMLPDLNNMDDCDL